MIGLRGLAAFSLLLLGACSHAGSVSRVATDYNRAFAEARDEQLLINILRAGAREPLLFSAPSEINASINRTAGLDTVAANLITGGRDAISPTLRLGGSTVPTVKIAPLSNKDFTDGILRPISPETLNLFINQGWDTEFLLPLVIAGYQCPGTGSPFVQNSGKAPDEMRSALARRGAGFRLRKEVIPGAPVVMTVATESALEMLRSGVAEGHKIKSVIPAAKGRMTVTLAGASKSEWVADLGNLCPGQNSKLAFAEGKEGDGYIQLRSPEGIIYFLGEVVRPCVLDPANGSCGIQYEKGEQDALARMSTDERRANTRQLFRIRAGPAPPDAAIATSFHDRQFSIARLDAEDRDRTLKTLSFLSQLISLQTSAVPLTPTIIGLPQ